MKRIIVCLCLLLCFVNVPTAYAQEEVEELYAQSAVLMDADSGRVLFEKNGFEMKPMASTTKIMTCILALENSQPEDVVFVTKEAAAQPKVRLGMKADEEYYMRDLLYSLMLESHNDSAVAIAEHIGGSVAGFAELMNQKAKNIGCENSLFITPNGLDASSLDASGNEQVHATTAADLARIMRYCIKQSPKRKEFLDITRTVTHSFTNTAQTSSHLCNNHNAFLQMMDGALTGKTGFTADAGYCYVGALERDGRTYIVALLACGWPNNKTYKWSDTKNLMEYGIQNYVSKTLEEVLGSQKPLDPVPVRHGQTAKLWEESLINLGIRKEEKSMLVSESDQAELIYEVPETLEAPVSKGTKIGSIKYLLNKEVWHEESIVAQESIEKIDLKWCAKQIFGLYFFSNFFSN